MNFLKNPYRTLNELISVEYNEFATVLTGNRNIDMKILNLLEDDKDLINCCKSSQYFCFLFSKEEFWLNRFLKRYSDEFIENIKDDLKYLCFSQSWKKYYFLFNNDDHIKCALFIIIKIHVNH